MSYAAPAPVDGYSAPQWTLPLHLSLGTSRLRWLGTQHPHQVWITLRLQGTLHLHLSAITLHICLRRTQCMPHLYLSWSTSRQASQCLLMFLSLWIRTLRLRL